MDAKYIVFRENGIERAIVFPFCVTHRYVWGAVRRSGRHNLAMREVELLGAGFWYVDSDGAPICHGRSETLELDSRGDADADAVARLLRGEG